MLGKTLSHYAVVEKLGQGGMGVVYRAYDMKLERQVALKVLPPAVADNPDARHRLVREARAIAKLHHPNICVVHEIDEVDGGLFIVMELVEGRTLREELARGPFEPRRVVDVARQIATGLDRAHRSGVIHRDIKPSNIMIAADGMVKVLDFGLAQFIREVTSDTTTTDPKVAEISGTPAVAGTVGYMSPEQLRREPLDARTDIFSLGVTLYEISGQQHPFARGSDLGTLAAVLAEDPPSLTTRVPTFPQALDALICRCLRKSRDERYESAQTLLADLKLVELGSGQSAAVGVRRPSLAVLPFASLAPPSAEDYFIDGVTNEIVSRLAKLKTLLVISRTSTMKYRGSRQDVREIGRELGVSTILEGTVARHQNRCRVTARLVRVGDGFHIWTDSYDFALGDFFAVQDRVARRIARALSLHFSTAEVDALTDTPPASIAAYQAYLQGKHFYYRFNNADNLIAVEAFRKAVGLDANFARAHAALAMALVARVERGWEPDRAKWVHDALESSSAAIRLNPNVSEAYSARALIEFFGKQLDQSEADVRRALSLNPNDDIAHNLLGRVHLQRGELLQAVRAFRQALRISPDYVWCLNDLSWTNWLLGRYRQVDRLLAHVVTISPLDESAHVGLAVQAYLRGDTRIALGETEKALQSNPAHPWARPVMAMSLAREGHFEEALRIAREGIDVASDDVLAYAALGMVHAERGDEAGLQQAQAHGLAVSPFYNPMMLSVAVHYAFLGRDDEARAWLHKGFTEGLRSRVVLQFNPFLRRFAEVFTDTGTPEGGQRWRESRSRKTRT
jgi:non-specific serine/threonine protein kinase